MTTKKKPIGYLFIGGMYDGQRYLTDGGLYWKIISKSTMCADSQSAYSPLAAVPEVTDSYIVTDRYNRHSIGGNIVYVHDSIQGIDELLSHFVSTYRKRKSKKSLTPRKKRPKVSGKIPNMHMMAHLLKNVSVSDLTGVQPMCAPVTPDLVGLQPMPYQVSSDLIVHAVTSVMLNTP